MKIGIDIRTLMDRYYGGISEFTYRLLKNILEIDQKNQYILYYNSWRNVSNRIPNFNSANVKIKFTQYPNKVFNYILQKGFKTPKIDQILGVDRFFMPHLNFAALSNNTRLILTVHDLSFLRFSEHFSLRKNIWHYLINARKLIERADQVIAISENTKNDIVNLCQIKENKIKVVYSGIGKQFKKLNLEKSEKREIRKKYKLPQKFIFSLNTIEPRKNIIGLIQAFELYCRESKNDAIDLVIAGAMGWKYKEIVKFWQNSLVKNRIHFIKYVDNKDKPILYNLAEIFVYPSFYEGFGFPPLEAMACACPVIAGNNSSLSEVCAEASVLVDSNNPQTINQAIFQVLNKEKIKQNLIKKGEIQIKRFNWRKTAREYIDIIY
ncbi:MAG: glycosyltransferase family 1 protein [Patescibacteria group bacterium]|nr:glycosyltransferase family 1 protein [Patescibacteria group bacterium]